MAHSLSPPPQRAVTLFAVILVGLVMAAGLTGYYIGAHHGYQQTLAEIERRAAAASVPELSEMALSFVQWGLKASGFDPGPIDGTLGRQTRDAIRRWQRHLGLPMTGSLTANQVEVLIAIGRTVPR